MMGAPFNDAALEVVDRAAAYRHFAHAFSYDGATSAEVGIPGDVYVAAFDPSVEEDACSLREGSHIEDDQSALFEELMRFYEFFGLARAEGAEMPDHLSVELEFMHYLTTLEAQVFHPEALDSLWRAQRDFLSRHLARLARWVQQGLNTEHEGCAELVARCHAFVQSDLQRAEARLA